MTDSTPAPTHQCGLRPPYIPAPLSGSPSTVPWLRDYLQRHGGLEGETLSELPDRGADYLRRLPCLDRLIVQWSDHPAAPAPMGFLRRIAPDHWLLLLCSEPLSVMELSTEEAHDGIRVLHPISLAEWGRMEMGGIAAWGGELGIDHHSPDPGGFNTVARNEPLPAPPPESPAPAERRGDSDGRRAGDGEGGAGRKFDAGKEPFGLLPWVALTWVARTLDYGARKYAPGNWRKVPQGSDRYFDAALRHLVAWRQGEAMDAESGLPHLACAACCVLFLLELEHPDPRAPQSPTSAGPIGR